MVLILLGMLLSSIAFGQVYLSNETLITSDRSMLESSLKFSPVGQDSFEFEYEKSPGKAFLLSNHPEKHFCYRQLCPVPVNIMRVQNGEPWHLSA
jgi:hypothetical protein